MFETALELLRCCHRPVAQSFDMKNLGETGLNQHAWSPMIWAKKEAIMKPLLLDGMLHAVVSHIDIKPETHAALPV